MLSHQQTYYDLIERVKRSSIKEVDSSHADRLATRVVYDPVTGLSTSYYEDRIVEEKPYKVDVYWKDQKDAGTQS
jgi:hypothetical protein